MTTESSKLISGGGMEFGGGRATAGSYCGGRALMRRFPHGVTKRPLPARPANGYGRTLRPGPDVRLVTRLLAEAHRQRRS